MKRGKSLSVLLTGLLLGACGGGGTSTTTTNVSGGTNSPATLADAGKTYTGNRSLAHLDGTNSMDFVRLILGTENINDTLSARPNTTNPTTDGNLYPVQRTMVRLASGQLAHNRYQAKAIATIEPCQEGGSVKTSGNLNDLTYTGDLQVSYNQCRNGNILLNGTANLIVHSFNTQLEEPVAFTLSMTGFDVSLNNVPYQMTGTLRADLNTVTGQTLLTENLSRHNLTTGRQGLADNVRVVENANGATAISGKFCDSLHGCVTATSTEDFLFWVGGLPAEGKLLLTGVANSKLEFITEYSHPVYSSSFQFNLDTNGDGTYESTFYRDETHLLAGNTADTGSSNSLPVVVLTDADALDRGIPLGGTLQLDTRYSYDPEYGLLSYQWTVASAPAGSMASIAGNQSALATFTPDKQGAYQINLKLTDPQGLSSLATFNLTVHGAARPLPYNVVDAEYNDAMERMVTVSSQPANSLHLINPTTGEQQVVALSLPPTTVSVSPDGKTAAVGHDGAVTYVNLVNASVIKFIDGIGFKVFDIALGNSPLAYASNANTSGRLAAINLSNGQVQLEPNAYWLGAIHLQLASGLNAIYAITTGVSPTDLNRYDLGGALPLWRYDSSYHGDYPMHENLWLTEDGASILTAGGTLFQTATQQAQDMRYQRSLPGWDNSQMYNKVLHADHSQEEAAFVVARFEHGMYTSGHLGAYNLQVYSTPLLNLESSLSINGLTLDGSSEVTIPQFVFFNSDGTKRYAVLKQGTGTYLMPF